MSTLEAIVPSFLKRVPSTFQECFEQFEFEDWGRKGVYLAITLFLAYSIYLGVYRCMFAAVVDRDYLVDMDLSQCTYRPFQMFQGLSLPVRKFKCCLDSRVPDVA